MKGYLSIRETSYKWGVSERRVIKPADPRKANRTKDKDV